MKNQRRGLLLLSVAMLVLATLLLGSLFIVSSEQPAWTSHNAELAGMVHKCPNQHAAAKASVTDGELGLQEARELIERCAIEILMALPD